MILFTPSEAMELRNITSGSTAALDPRLIKAGEYVGQYAVPARALNDPELTYVRGFLQNGVVAEVNTDEAFPISDE